MMAEVLHDAIVQVTEVPTRFEWLAGQGGERRKTNFYPLGTRAIQLYDATVESYFLQAFGRNPRRIVCECDRSEEPTVVQVLHISNGNTLNDKLKAPGNRVEKLTSSGAGACPMPRWSTSSTSPAWPAIRRCRSAIAWSRCCPRRARTKSERSSRIVLWGLLSSREFLFNH